MNPSKPPKNIRRKIKELSLKAYEAELREHLGELYCNFQDWDNNKLKSGELVELIHKFHNGPARDMYKYYNHVDSDLAVGRAIVLKLLSKDEIPDEVYPYISNSIEFYKNL